jgi:hypothetical protein
VCGDVASLVSTQGGNPYRIQMNVAVDLQRFCWLVEDVDAAEAQAIRERGALVASLSKR